MTKKQKIEFVIKELESRYGIPDTFLNYETEYQLMIAVILSAQCTDERVNLVTKELFKYVKDPYDIEKMPIETLERLIFSTGFYNSKAKNIKKNASILIEKYSGKIPKNIDELVKLPGVGRKTANVVMQELWGIKEGIVVDTHVIRISKLLGFTKSSNPITIEKELMEIVPKKYWRLISLYFILHGREKCIQRKLECNVCDLYRVK